MSAAQSQGEPSLRGHLSPLRYPGGKAKLADLVKATIETNGLQDGTYVEAYAGGAAIAVELLAHEYVRNIFINDISRPVIAFWRSVLEDTDPLCRLIRDTPVTVEIWKRQKQIFSNPDGYDELTLGFATFFLNRTNRSGILNGGVIGGRDQGGPWKIDARFNRGNLIARIEAIARLRRRISLSRCDAIEFMSSILPGLPKNTLVYLDPPYYRKGKDLYYDYYTHEDHVAINEFVRKRLKNRHWIVSYDDAPEIRNLYSSFAGVPYQIGYSAREVRKGSEIMFFSTSLVRPAFP